MKNISTILSWIAVAALVAPLPEIFASDGGAVPAQSVPAKRKVNMEYRLPVLSVNDATGGKLQWLDFEFRRKATEAPLKVFTGNVESGATGQEIRASVWSAAMVAALMRGDLMTGTSIVVGFPGSMDGPSAGGIFCLAILSALDGREFPQDFAMTGTILPDGSIGLVGGVAEKIKAAAKAGIKRVCVPALGRVEDDGDTLTDLKAVAKRNGVELIFVETVEEAYAAAHRLPLPKKEVFSEREILSVPAEQEDVWYDNMFRDYNRCSAIVRRHGRSSEPFYSRYYDDRLRSLNLFKAGYFQGAAENAFESLLFMRAWDWFDYVFDDFLRTNPDGKKALFDCYKNPDKPATEEDRKALEAFREHTVKFLQNSARIPEPEKNDPAVSRGPDGTGFYRGAPWVTEITAQLEPVLADEDAFAWLDYLGKFEENDLSKLKTKDDVSEQIQRRRRLITSGRFAAIRDNERSYFLELAAVIPQIRGNANLMKAGAFYHAAQSAVYYGLRSGFGEYFSDKYNDRQLHRFLNGCRESDQRFSNVINGKKIADPAYNALARIITDCRLLALGAALQIQYGPDVGGVQRETIWVNNYEKTHFLNALIRTARRQTLSKIKQCRDKNIPCPAALSAFVEAEASHGDRERDMLFDVLMNYWIAGNIAQALNLCFDAQPSTELAAERGNADALWLLGYREGVSGDIEKAYALLKKSAEQGDARAQFWLSGIEERQNKNNKAALMCLQKSAEQNYLPALERLAAWYWHGKDGFVTQDRKKAVPLFKTAAYLGSAEAQSYLAWCYINENEIVPENLSLGKEWQRLAAERDDVWAQWRMAGDCESMAASDEENKDLLFGAFRWYSRAAEQGHPAACVIVGDYYLKGICVDKDEKTAVQWFKKSAELGDEVGQYRYGFHLYRGIGVERDEAEGLKWLRKAAENGSEDAKKYLEEIGEK